MFRTVFLFACASALLLAFPSAGWAVIPDLTWQATEVVDAPVADLPAGGGACAVYYEDAWRLVYIKAGQVWAASRTAGGWHPPVALTESPSIPSAPHLAVGAGRLHLVWQDDRSGHPEVWTRALTADIWGLASSLTDDATPSAAPVVAGNESVAVVVWEEGLGASARIQSRSYHDGVWSPPEMVSSGSAAAIEPTVCTAGWIGDFLVAWSDARHGETEIYRRTSTDGTGWQDEVRVTDLPGPCRRPSINSQMCCWDNITLSTYVSFENTAPSGVTETWGAAEMYYDVWAEMLSADDGIPSTSPVASGSMFVGSECYFGGPMPRYWISWTDAIGAGTGTAQLALTHENVGPAGTEAMASSIFGRTTVAGMDGDPQDSLLACWCEIRGGTPTLVARRGAIPGCFRVAVRAPLALLLAPQGLPEMVLQRFDECSGEDLPGAGCMYGLTFAPALDAALTWDPIQEHPQVIRNSDAQGRTVFALRGGGCSHAGGAVVNCQVYGPVETEWPGAKSPDVDGDCAVQVDDLDYVQTRLGTSDFCADLDGSGLVDTADVAIVEATMGDLCSHLIGVQGPLNATTCRLSVQPNPARGVAVVTLTGPLTGSVSFRVVDVQGRLVREAPAPASSGRCSWAWDTRDGAGRLVASGHYTLIAAGADRVERKTLLVLR